MYELRIDGILVTHRKWLRHKSKLKIKSRFYGRCIYCDAASFSSLTRDHITPRDSGGLTIYENLAPCCSRCNISKSNQNVYEWLDKVGLLNGETIIRIGIIQFSASSRLFWKPEIMPKMLFIWLCVVDCWLVAD